ncbi:MAG: type III pantothenate kinase [Alphaproteobacteria bacterium]|nr:type III pantothenate kinase [Alphaproteobacteria bacterium]
MLVAIDVGNTNTKFSVWDGEAWRAQWRISTDTSRTADEYAPWLYQVMQLADLSFADLSACIISTVVPQALFNLRNLSRRYVGAEPMVIGEGGLDLGIEVRIEKPREAGADRLVNAVGAFVQYGGPAIVIDSGTATTFDIVGADGAFEGGVILPGINLSLQALHEHAARLPRVEIRDPGCVIGYDTVSAMQSGIYWGSIEMIEGLCRRIRDEYGKPMKTIATGGVASLFEGAFPTIDHFDQDITSRGLLEIFRRNGGAL